MDMDITAETAKIRRFAEQAADSFKVHFLDIVSDHIARFTKIMGEQEMRAEKAEKAVANAEQRLSVLNKEIEKADNELREKSAKVEALDKKIADLESKANEFETRMKRYRDNMEKEVKHLQAARVD
jgi:chromosome segregation ATPase